MQWVEMESAGRTTPKCEPLIYLYVYKTNTFDVIYTPISGQSENCPPIKDSPVYGVCRRRIFFDY